MKRTLFLFVALFVPLAAKEAHLHLNGEAIGSVDINYEDMSATLDEKIITPELKGRLNATGERILGEILKKKVDLCCQEGKSIRSVYFRLVCDEPLDLRLLIPPQLLSGCTLKNSEIFYENEPYQYPAKQSFYVNLMAGQKIIHNYFVLNDPKTPHHETFANFDLVANLKEFVLQGYFYYVASEKNGINRGNVLLSRDFENKKVRVSAGNINYMTMGFQNSIPLFGLNFSKNEQIFTNPLMGPLSRHEFFLNAPSKIDVEIDGIYTTTIEAPAGPLLVSSFPIIQGLNNVKLKITGAAGEKITVDLGSFYLADLLKRADDNLIATVGFPTFDPISNKTAYQWNNLTLSFLYKRGLSDAWSLGGYLQGQPHQGYAGVQSVNAIGSVKSLLDVAFSKYIGFPFAFRTRWQLSPFTPPGEKPSIYKWKFAVDGMSPWFSYLGNKPKENDVIIKVGGAVGRDLPNGASANLIANVDFLRPLAGKPGGSRVTSEVQLQQRFACDWIVKMNATTSSTNGNINNTLLFGLDYAPKDNKTKINTSYNTQQELAVMSASKTFSLPGDRSLTIAGGGSHGPKAWNGTGTANYQGSMVELLATHYMAKSSLINPDTTLGVSFFSGGAALVEADGVFAISRPVADSFIIVLPDSNETTTFVVNPTPDGDYTARRGPLGRTVISKVPSYKPYDIHATDHTGEALGHRHRSVYPRYKSGTVIRVGKEELFDLHARLYAEGKPLGVENGMLVRADENPPRIYPFALDSKGNLDLEDIPRGRYILLVDNYDLEETLIVVDPSESEQEQDLVDLGNVNVRLQERYDLPPSKEPSLN